jgi:glycerate 2-kinase
MHPEQHLPMIPDPASFLTDSLRRHQGGDKTARILAASLAAVDPARVLSSNLVYDGSHLRIRNEFIPLEDYERIIMLAIGKAALPMGLHLEKLIGSHLTESIILTKSNNQELPDSFDNRSALYFGGHPIPDKKSTLSTEAIIKQFSDLTNKDLVFFLLSGGSSALLCKPAPGLTLADLQKTNQVLLGSGAAIQEINTVRKHISGIKGGQLAKILAPARLITLALSDVIGDQIDQIGSGPSVPDPTTFNDAMDVVQSYNLGELLPPAIIQHLELGIQKKNPETPKPDDPVFNNNSSFILGGIKQAINGAISQAGQEGLKASQGDQILTGEASLMGPALVKEFSGLIDKLSPGDPAHVLVTGGETTVHLEPAPPPGRGGRNLELALSTVKDLDGMPDIFLITLATDGEDGTTDAAGAVVTGETYQRALKRGLDPEEFLARHDSYTFFESLGDLIIIGSTQTNVNDLCYFFIW